MTNPRFDENVSKRKNRRRMAWVSLVSMIVIMFLLLFFVSTERIQELIPIIDTFFVMLSSIVGAYMGVALMDDNNIMRSHNEREKFTNVIKPNIEEETKNITAG